MKERINLTHNDLDGAGSNIVLREKFGDMDTFHVSYGSVTDTLKSIDLDINHLTKTLFVTDLSFDKDAFLELMRVAEGHPHIKIIFIDHHPYEGDVLETFNELASFPNVYCKHEIGKSATLLTYEFTHSVNEDLGKLVGFINAFDIYKEFEDPTNFKIGWFLNSVFWELKLSAFKSNIIRNQYKIPKMFKDIYVKILEDKDRYFKSLIENNIAVFDEENSILLAFCDKHKSFWQNDYPDFDYYVLPYETKGKNISIRFSHRVDNTDAKQLKDTILWYVRQNPMVISSGGHDHAFGITIDDNMLRDDHLGIIEGIIEIIEDHINTPF